MDCKIVAGTIVWVRLGPRGGWKPRPAVVLSAPNVNGELYIVPGSTQPATNPDHQLELPYAVGRHPLTKLKERTLIDLDWFEKIDAGSVLEVNGYCPPSLLVEIQQKIRALHPKIPKR